LASKRKSSEVGLEDIRRAYEMFLDVKRSTEYLKDHQKEYLFSEETQLQASNSNKMDVEN